jgi:hypothetical protein
MTKGELRRFDRCSSVQSQQVDAAFADFVLLDFTGPLSSRACRGKRRSSLLASARSKRLRYELVA